MTWNWQKPDWACFAYDKNRLEPLEAQLLHKSGLLCGAFKHLDSSEQLHLTIELISDEALKTSEIEGDYLERSSLQSSIRRHFGLDASHRNSPPAEQGIADMMVDLYRHFDTRLTHATLFSWHALLMSGRQLHDVGCYRTHAEAMQVVSGRLDAPKVHFEAPPSDQVPVEMQRFIAWFNDTAPDGATPLPILTRAGIAHLYFVSIHPFEDGNGRIGRALAEKVLAQGLGQPSLTALAQTIEKHRKAYYAALEQTNRNNEITAWLNYFAETILAAQRCTLCRVEFLIEKAKLYGRLTEPLNARQEKVLERMFREGPEGYKGGLSAENYINLTRASRATATRDLQDLVASGALTRTGERKHTRYYLNLKI
ncbi:MAG: Fic family protein [Methylococcaceae bacterium]|nr:MAG: Fic family protein [Methylococcaceae bacterium]